MILGIDCATKTGWCLLKDGKVYESGVQDFSKQRGESNGAVFLRFRTWLRSMFTHYGKCDIVIYEQAHHRGGAATEIAVNLTGRVQEMCVDYGMEYAAVHTATLKKWATGMGNADKAAMIKRAAKVLGRDPVDDNEADAVLLALYGHETYISR